MDKRYQVFISSTFADLEDERKEVMEAIINLNCFPAGMEMFPAADIEQFEYIKTIIDQSDYYVLVIAGRYGSVSDDGISYTEKEYEYAKEKGIPVLAFVKKDIDNLLVKQTDNNPELKQKLLDFREKAMKNRLAKYWNEKMELKYNVHDSLSKSFQLSPRVGWVKGDIENNEKLLQQLNQSRQECDDLKKELTARKKLNSEDANLEEVLTLIKNKSTFIRYYDHIDNERNVKLMVKSIFIFIGQILDLKNGILKSSFSDYIATLIKKHYSDGLFLSISTDDTYRILVLFQELRLIESSNNSIYLTTQGKKVLFKLVLEN
ncbi:DUF4062 domain-containing protein [Clostridium intestinale]|uniref:DUF4062 domain-containing protein n=1 Tax=Clostridium intestinale DSM 6191 TaxID=1121320 RepID=A0A1M5U1R4_9CLOT|nr:DUF4062 domain-containing protein [Clostridium intestinale]SHH56977.1 protein of unknown function [Clostridium intestinale DSM 6191]